MQISRKLPQYVIQSEETVVREYGGPAWHDRQPAGISAADEGEADKG